MGTFVGTFVVNHGSHEIRLGLGLGLGLGLRLRLRLSYGLGEMGMGVEAMFAGTEGGE
jgi:hypothetical protein